MKKMLMRLISLLGIIIFLLTTASACALKLSEEEVKGWQSSWRNGSRRSRS